MKAQADSAHVRRGKYQNTLLLPVKDVELGKEFSPEIDPAGPWPGTSSLRNNEGEFLCLNHPVYVSLSGHPNRLIHHENKTKRKPILRKQYANPIYMFSILRKSCIQSHKKSISWFKCKRKKTFVQERKPLCNSGRKLGIALSVMQWQFQKKIMT